MFCFKNKLFFFIIIIYIINYSFWNFAVFLSFVLIVFFFFFFLLLYIQCCPHHLHFQYRRFHYHFYHHNHYHHHHHHPLQLYNIFCFVFWFICGYNCLFIGKRRPCFCCCCCCCCWKQFSDSAYIVFLILHVRSIIFDIHFYILKLLHLYFLPKLLFHHCLF